ncbi:TPA: LysR family transcriptional regulator [Photobacterium damselae]|uniref:LysR family transcriptional regulator n=1 Tax=Photobacterium damselae TaxID=38293 RepID=UPI0025428A6C
MDFASRLLLLLEVIEQGSFTNVANQKNVDRSVISKQINKLEKELGVRLLNRTTRSLSLTAAGNEMVSQADKLRTLLSNTHRLAQNYHHEPRGTLRVTSSIMFGRQYVQDAISQFQKEYPEVGCELRLEDRLVDIVKEGFDIGFRLGKPKDSGLICKKITNSRLLIVATPEFIKQFGPIDNIEQLEAAPATVYSAPGLLLNKFTYQDDSGIEQTFQLNPVYKVNDTEMIVKSALAGNTLAVVTTQMIHHEIQEGLLNPILPQLNLDDYGIFYAVYPHRDAPIKTKLFIETLKSIIEKDSQTVTNNLSHQ